MMIKSILRAFAIAVVLTGISANVSPAQDGAALQQRLDRLERDIQTLNRNLARGENAPPPSAWTPDSVAVSSQAAAPLTGVAAARIGERLDVLERDLRFATGSAEEMNHRLDQLTKRIDKLVGDIDFRLNGLEQHVIGAQAAQGAPAAGGDAQPLQTAGVASSNEAPAGTPAPNAGSVTVIGQGPKSLGSVDADLVEAVKATETLGRVVETAARTAGAPAPSNAPRPSPIANAQPASTIQTPRPPRPAARSGPILPEGDPQAQYDFAFNLVRQHQLDQAELAFAEFVTRNADHKLAPNSIYWKGETYYARGLYVDAAKTFLQGFEKYPQSSKAPDSLLKLGLALERLGEKDQACGALGKLFNDFPALSSTLKRRAAAAQRKIGCP